MSDSLWELRRSATCLRRHFISISEWCQYLAREDVVYSNGQPCLTQPSRVCLVLLKRKMLQHASNSRSIGTTLSWKISLLVTPGTEEKGVATQLGMSVSDSVPKRNTSWRVRRERTWNVQLTWGRVKSDWTEETKVVMAGEGWMWCLCVTPVSAPRRWTSAYFFASY